MKKFVYTIVILTIFSLTFSALSSAEPIAQAQTQPTVFIDPSPYNATQVDEIFPLDIKIADVQNLGLWSMQVEWDPTYLYLTESANEGGFLKSAGSTLFLSLAPSNGTINGGIVNSVLTDTGASGSGTLATLYFQILSPCVETSVLLSNITLYEPNKSDDKIGTLPTPIIPVSDSVSGFVSLILPGGPNANAGKSQAFPEGSTVTLDASKSLSLGENPTYTWSFVDGTPQTLEGEIVTYTFDHSGVYNVTLTLQDSLGTDTDTLLLTIQDTTPPVAIIKYQNTTVSQSITVGIGQIVILDGSDSYDPENGTLTSYSWTSSGAMAKIGPVRNFSYPNPGTYEIALTVKDASLNNDTQTLFISVVEDPTQSPTLPPAKTPDATLPSSTTTPTTTTQSPPSPEYTPTPTAETSALESASLPPTILGVLVAITVFTLVGSGFWLRKRT
jgi:PKD repeat protein